MPLTPHRLADDAELRIKFAKQRHSNTTFRGICIDSRKLWANTMLTPQITAEVGVNLNALHITLCKQCRVILNTLPDWAMAAEEI